MDITNVMSFRLAGLILASLLAIHFLLKKIYRHAMASKSSCTRKLPPGPYPLPILGNLLSLGKKPHRSLAELAKTYGPVMTLQLGQLTTVVISSTSMAKEVLQKKDIYFCDRSVVDAARGTDHDQYSVGWLPVGTTRWKELRKISNSNLFTTSKLDGGKELRRQKIADLLSYVEKCCQDGIAVDIGEAGFNTVLNLLSNTFFSMDLANPSSEASHEFKKLMTLMMVEAGKPNLADYFPVLKRFDPQGNRRRQTIYFSKMINVMDGITEDRLAGKHKHDSAKEMDTLDAFLRIKQENSAAEEFDRPLMLHLFLDLFIGGTETNSSMLEWAMTELLRHPEKMNKAKAELAASIGERDRPFDEEDLNMLPYLHAVVKETFRLHPPLPFLVPRKVNADVNLGDSFTVQKNSQVLVNVWAIGRDPARWENPCAFEPERFLGSAIDVKGQDFELTPFGAGRRICPGLPLAIRILPLMLANLLHSYNWKLENGMEGEGGIMDMDEKYGMTMRKAKALRVIPVRPDV